MKSYFKKILSAVLCVILMAVAMPIAAVEPQEEPIKILAIGNSYSCNSTQFISKIAETLGKKVTVTVLYYGGCTLEQHVGFYNNNSSVYRFYTDGVMDYGSYKTMKDAFNADDYDYVTLHQGTSTAAVFDTYWTEEKPWLTDLYSIIQEYEPQAKVMINQTWSFCETCVTEPRDIWPEPYEYSVGMFKDIEANYEKAADMLGLNKETDIIPVGKAVQLAKDEYGFGDFHVAESTTGLTDAQLCANGCLYTDNIHHLNIRGRYIAGCVWLEKIFGLDCRKATFYPEGVLTAEECVILRNIAHEAVTGEKAYIEGDWRVLPDGDGVELLHYYGDVPATGTLTVPTVVNGKTVTRVDDTAYKYVDGLKKLILPEADIVYEDGALDAFTILEDVWDGTSLKPTEGDGTENNPYKIYNGSHLYWAVTNNNKGVYFEVQNNILLNDMVVDLENKSVVIDQNTHQWYLGGSNEAVRFEGIIDGKNHVIKGLYIDNDYKAEENKWNHGAGLIARAGDGAVIKNLAINDSYIKAVNGAASAFVGTTGSGVYDVSLENCYVGENVYIFGAEAGGMIGAGNGSGYVSGISNCYNLGLVEADGFVGGIVGGVWSGTNCPVTNCYATNVKLYGQNPMKFTNCFATLGTATNGITILAIEEMQGTAAMTKMASLKDVYTLPYNGTPVLKSFVGKSNAIWSGFIGSALEGAGTEESPYLITNGEELAYAINGGGKGKYYRLENDIYLNDINGVDWSTGEAKNNYAPSTWICDTVFTGYFDGNGHIVYGIYYPKNYGAHLSASGYAGLIPQITKNTHVTNVGVRYSHIEILGRAGGIVGSVVTQKTSNVNTLIDSCFTDETVYVNTYRLDTTNPASGGILGGTLQTPNVKISNCYSFANVGGSYSKNKIVGSTWQCPETVVFENCYADGSLWLCSSTGNAVKTATNCYSTVAPNETYTTWTQLSTEQMKGENALTNMPLGDKFAITDGYPVLKVFLKEKTLIGDVDSDGKIDTTDLATLKLFLAGISIDISDGADMNGDIEIDTTDLALLKLYLANN
ncbi:MAG: DUF4886 domain-containing protein [Clostridia bacterium]|nr:DUF4886 domain-containing protein [Clostridia bacterium]